MSKRTGSSWCFLTIALVSFAGGCEKQQIREARFKAAVEEALNPDLIGISESLAIIDAENKLKQSSQCMLVRVRPSSASAARHKALCEAYTQATEDMSIIVRNALDSKQRPRDAYVFYLWDPPNDLQKCDSSLLDSVSDCELVVGLFSSLEACERAEAVVRGSDAGTRRCRSWTEEEFYKSDHPNNK